VGSLQGSILPRPGAIRGVCDGIVTYDARLRDAAQGLGLRAVAP
jgi:hypothetical protein